MLILIYTPGARIVEVYEKKLYVTEKSKIYQQNMRQENGHTAALPPVRESLVQQASQAGTLAPFV
jgi:hypothetical protein